MDDCLGRLVLSTAGRDKGCVCVIIAIHDENGYVLIADGKLHKVEKPKKKKLKHIIPVDWVPEDKQVLTADRLTNRFIREAVADVGEVPTDTV